MAEHILLPWFIENEDALECEIVAPDGRVDEPWNIALVYDGANGERSLNIARFIVEACNSHYDLTARCERLREALEALLIQAIQSSVSNPENEWGREALEQARAALSEGDG